MVLFELEAFSEPKALSETELELLLPVHMSISALARHIDTNFPTFMSDYDPLENGIQRNENLFAYNKY